MQGNTVTLESSTRALAGKYLTFRLADESYGLPILKVQEIIAMMNVTRMPRSPHWVRGVINLRGKIIPVVDLRARFDMEAKEDTDRTCIVVVQICRSSDTITTGLIVDEVSEVVNIGGEAIEPPPSFGAGVDTAFVLGMGKVAQRVVILLDVDKALADEDAAVLGQLAAEGDVEAVA